MVIFVRCVARSQYLYVIQTSTLGPQLNSEPPTYSRPLLSSWTFLSHPPERPLPPFLETRQYGCLELAATDSPSPILTGISEATWAPSELDTLRRRYIPTISTSYISCSSLPFPIAGTTHDDSICLITRKTHAPPLEHLSNFPILRQPFYSRP